MRCDVCAIGPITRESEVFQGTYRVFTGGPPYFFSAALKRLGSEVVVVTKISPKDGELVRGLEELGVKVVIRWSRETSSFHTIYGKSLDERYIKVLGVADPFTVSDLKYCGESRYIYLGPLTTRDFNLEFMEEARGRAPLILDVQGFNREVVDGGVRYVDWPWKVEGSKYVEIFKADANEARILTGVPDPAKAAEVIASWGPSEVVVTSSSGVHLHVKGEGGFFAPFKVGEVKGRVGRGDTCLASYVHARLKGMGCDIAVKFAAAATSLKLTYQGPLKNSEGEVLEFMRRNY